jgi:hypothetical protein
MNSTTLHLTLLLLRASVAHAEGGEIVGTWAADARTKGGLASMMVFSESGLVTTTFGAVVDFKYEIDGQSIRTIYERDKTGNSDHKWTYKIVADTLIIDGENPDHTKQLEMKRIGPVTPGTQPVVGVWQFMHYTGVPATWQYTTNGLAQLSVPMHTSRGRYTVSGSTLSLAMDRESPAEFKIELRGDSLTIVEPKGQRRFTRVVP